MKPIQTIDLFAGAGGITEGFRLAGANCVFANDFNPHACETFRNNHPGVPMVCGPIQGLDAKRIKKSLGLKKGDLDILVGGPPCQGFSINAPERFLEDPRNSLFNVSFNICGGSHFGNSVRNHSKLFHPVIL